MIEKELKIRDMQEIKHGTWEYDSGGVNCAIYLCSECGNFIAFYAGVFSEVIDLYPYRPYSYCPYCGAKMDKE